MQQTVQSGNNMLQQKQGNIQHVCNIVQPKQYNRDTICIAIQRINLIKNLQLHLQHGHNMMQHKPHSQSA